MSLVCCETLPTTITSCASEDISIVSVIGPPLTKTSQNVLIDVSRAPYRRVCITVSAPVSLYYDSDTYFGTSDVTLSLYRNGVLASIASVQLSATIPVIPEASAQKVSLTPILVHQADPGVFHATLTATYSNQTGAGASFHVDGRINISASVASLAL
jgi:hypothetical protein